MKYKIFKPVEVNIKTLEANMGVRYWEDATVNGIEDKDGTLIPLRRVDNWHIVIDIDKGQILNWKLGTIANVHYKVCDAGIYRLCADDGELIAEQQGYVPSIMCPEGIGYGDYVIMKIDAEGFINNWNANEQQINYFLGEE